MTGGELPGAGARAGAGGGAERSGGRCSPHGCGSGAGAEPSLGWRSARPPPSSASSLPAALLSPAHRHRLSPALSLFLCPAVPALPLRDGLGTALPGEGGVPAPATAKGEGREGLLKCRYPSAAATRAHVTWTPPRLPPALPRVPLTPTPGLSPPTLTPTPGLSSTHPHTDPGAVLDPPSHRPRGCPRPTLTPTPGLSPIHPHTAPGAVLDPPSHRRRGFPRAAWRCRGDGPCPGAPAGVRREAGDAQALPPRRWPLVGTGEREPPARYLLSWPAVPERGSPHPPREPPAPPRGSASAGVRRHSCPWSTLTCPNAMWALLQPCPEAEPQHPAAEKSVIPRNPLTKQMEKLLCLKTALRRAAFLSWRGCYLHGKILYVLCMFLVFFPQNHPRKFLLNNICSNHRLAARVFILQTFGYFAVLIQKKSNGTGTSSGL
ncbi:leucine-rich repeat extensin-like protein 5 [Corapipo altera]|uniref:leucine-rich repeat extensin-like protein 5 n=1 Tax=Corapipo altera TaxID=415028 RepID=UPI000FD6A51F|nr:leucine-rich repeat extensin-like protein 5 [Corapipo altera]